MSVASMNEIPESAKSDWIKKLLGEIGDLDKLKKEIDVFELRYELT